MPRSITIHHSRSPVPMNPRLDDPIWSAVPWSERFTDLISGEPVIFDTRVKCLYDDDALYIAIRAEEPFLRARLTERDSIIFQESDLEIFIGGDDGYYELEVNALGTVYEVFYIWRDAYLNNGWRNRPEFDLLAAQARTFGGNFDRTEEHFWTGTHPRGDRFAFIHYDLPGLETAVHLDGTLNDDSDIDRGWNLLSACRGRACATSAAETLFRPATATPCASAFTALSSCATPDRRSASAGRSIPCMSTAATTPTISPP